jgi:tellurium resistance protein TerD
MPLVAISLSKGENINLSKGVADAGGGTLTSVTVGLGWEARTTDGKPFDLDASAIGVDVNGKAPSEHWFVFYGKGYNVSADGSIVYGGDNTTGEGEGDDETIKVNLGALSAEIDRVVIAVSIFEATERLQKFGQVRNAYIRVVNDADGAEIPGARFDLTEDFSTETALVFGELYRKDGDWKFRAVGQGYTTGLAGVMKDFGLDGSGG